MKNNVIIERSAGSMDLPNLNLLVNIAIEQSFNAVLITDAKPGPEGQSILFANRAFCDMTGYTLADLLGKTPRILQGPKTNQKVIAELRKSLAKGEPFTGASVNYRKDGTFYDVEWHISPIFDETGEITHFISMQQDISAFVAAKKSEALLIQALNASQVAIIIVDKQGTIEFANQGFSDLFGYPSHIVKGKDARFVKAKEGNDIYFKNIVKSLKEDKAYEASSVNVHHDGTVVHCDEKISPLYDCDGNITHYVAAMKNVTEHIERERVLQEQASTDPLTSLYNRRAGHKELELAFKNATAKDQPFCVIMADIDHFKPVNDNYGHQKGDEILREIAQLIKHKIRSSDTAIRWGGEEFLVLLKNCKSSDIIAQVEDLREQIAAHTFTDVGQVTMSFGVADFSSGESLKALIERADKALYSAKSNGRNRVETAPH
ncbi:MAG: diguanylate cyclase [Idiomarina sp.]|nr:diguanylate cyclase [Idiomarina sp.]